MNKVNTAPVVGRNFVRFFQYALTALMLTAFSGAALAEKINLNTADAEALQYIPGIGPGKSAEIIRVREETGGFNTIEDLLAVPGIGEKILLDIRQFGALNDGVSALTEEMEANPPKSVSAKQKTADGTGASS